MKNIFLVIVLLFTGSAIAADAVNTKVNMVGVLEGGVLFVEFPVKIGDPACRQYQLRLAHDHVAKQEILDLALAAYGREVSIKPNGCFGEHPTLVGGGFFT